MLVHRHWRDLLALTVLVVAGWLFLVWGAFDVTGPLARLTMPMSSAWTPGNAVAVFFMWAVMMAAMMLPSALPMVLTYANLNARRGQPALTRHFTAAYIAMWSAFSLFVTLLQWLFQRAELTTAMIESRSATFGGVLLLVAGLYQLSPLKTMCLRHCRTPLGFLLNDWRDGVSGAWIMGLRHGGYCLGCCWALMLLLFVAGVMNLLWILAISVMVGIEKILPGGDRLSRYLGLALIGLGLMGLTGGLRPA